MNLDLAALLEEDIADIHAEREARNARKASCWTGENNFSFSGIVGKTNLYRCRCGDEQEIVLGIFELWTRGPDARRFVAVDPNHYSPSPSLEFSVEREIIETPICVQCLSTRGFKVP